METGIVKKPKRRKMASSTKGTSTEVVLMVRKRSGSFLHSLVSNVRHLLEQRKIDEVSVS